MALEAGRAVTIKGKALTTKASKTWAKDKFGEWWQKAHIPGVVVKVNSKTVKIDLGDGIMVELKKDGLATQVAGPAPTTAPPSPTAAGCGDSDNEEHRAQAAADDSDSDSDSEEEGHVESDDDEAPAAAGAGGTPPSGADFVSMTNKAGSYVVDWHKVDNIRVDARTGPRSKPAMLWPPDVKGRDEVDCFFHFFPRTNTRLFIPGEQLSLNVTGDSAKTLSVLLVGNMGGVVDDCGLRFVHKYRRPPQNTPDLGVQRIFPEKRLRFVHKYRGAPVLVHKSESTVIENTPHIS